MKTKRILNCKFTTEELKEIGVKLALENQRKERLQDSLKQASAQFKSEITESESTIRSLAQKLARGSEDREIECDILFNTPEEGKKTVKRGDTGEVVQVQDMTESELNDLFVNGLGARKDENEFVFRDKSRAKMCSIAEFEKLKKKCGVKAKDMFEKIGDGYTEEDLVDAKPENVELALVVYDLDPETKKDVFEVYRFTMTENQDQQPDQSAPKMLADGAEVIDAETAEPEAGK